MTENAYTAIAPIYDKLGDHIDYDAYAAFIRREADAMGIPGDSLALDVGCGTGALTLRLAAMGYDMIGVDASADMLARAMDATAGQKVLWLRQDMREFELYGTVRLAVCTVDAFNYLLTTKDVERFLWAIHNYLEPGSLFLFDVNTPYKFSTVYGSRDYILEEQGALCCWRNDYREKSKLCDFCLTVFTEQPDGSYLRRDEWQRERCWPDASIRRMLKKAGLEVVKVCGDLSGNPITETDERRFWVCRRP